MVKQDDLKISHLCILFADTVFILTLFILTQFFVNIDALYYRSSKFKKMAYKSKNCDRTASISTWKAIVIVYYKVATIRMRL